MKTLQQIKADLDEANFGTYDMVQEMRGVIGEVENTMNRLESAQRRTV